MQCNKCKSALRKDKLTGWHWCPVCSFENAHREKLAAQSELAALRQRVAELEATVSGLESDNGELSDKLSQSEALRIDAEQAAQSIFTPNNCRHCQRAAEKMREAAAGIVQNELDWLRDEDDKRFAYGQRIMKSIRALQLPACDGCNPLKPD